MNPYSIRPANLEDASQIKAIAVAAKMFSEEDVDFLDRMFPSSENTAEETHFFVLEGRDDEVIASAYVAPEPFSDRMWNLYFIAVSPEHQGQKIGQKLLKHIEKILQQKGSQYARTLIVETSSASQYVTARAFYLRSGYTQEAQIRQFYGPHEHKIVYWKL